MAVYVYCMNAPKGLKNIAKEVLTKEKTNKPEEGTAETKISK